jgi:hypothetical protein
MQVEFHRTGERRYSVVVHRNGLPPLRMDPAPGYDRLMPHDMLHFVVEKELGLRRGIFGQIAAGGTSGTFHLTQSATFDDRTNSRRRRSVKKRGKKLLEEGQLDSAQSERATYVCLYDWLSSSSNPDIQIRAADMKDTARSILNSMSESERKSLTNKFLAKVRSHLDKLSSQWSALQIGQYMTVEWSHQKK